MISVDKVTKKFKDKTVLHNVSFEAKKGEIIGFLGPNGAGKTTTMRIILGYLTPTSGSVKINGLNPQEDRIKILSTVGYCPKTIRFIPK